MAEKDKRFYWFKLKEDFFKRHDIKILRAMPNGLDYIIVYLSLLCESLAHDGRLRFSEAIPYDVYMLAAVTETNVDIVKGAMDVFVKLGLVEIFDDGTLYMTQIEKLIGSETYWAERKRIARAEAEKAKLEAEAHALPELLDNVQRVSNMSKQEIDIDTDIEIEIDTDIDKKATTVAKERIPYKKIVGIYNTICISLPKVEMITDARRKAIKARYKEYGFDGLKEIFEAAEASDWLAGRKGDWSANFDWLMKPTNAVKVLEGNYKNKGGKGNAGYSNNNSKSDADYYSADFRQA